MKNLEIIIAFGGLGIRVATCADAVWTSKAMLREIA